MPLEEDFTICACCCTAKSRYCFFVIVPYDGTIN